MLHHQSRTNMRAVASAVRLPRHQIAAQLAPAAAHGLCELQAYLIQQGCSWCGPSVPAWHVHSRLSPAKEAIASCDLRSMFCPQVKVCYVTVLLSRELQPACSKFTNVLLKANSRLPSVESPPVTSKITEVNVLHSFGAYKVDCGLTRAHSQEVQQAPRL